MSSTKSPKSSKRSPGRSRKSTVHNIEKSLENPTERVIMGFEGVSFLFLLGGIAAAVAWMVYVAKFNINLYTKIDKDKTKGDNIPDNVTLTDFLTIDQYTICYQAVVASLLLYFCFRYHFSE